MNLGQIFFGGKKKAKQTPKPASRDAEVGAHLTNGDGKDAVLRTEFGDGLETSEPAKPGRPASMVFTTTAITHVASARNLSTEPPEKPGERVPFFEEKALTSESLVEDAQYMSDDDEIFSSSALGSPIAKSSTLAFRMANSVQRGEESVSAQEKDDELWTYPRPLDTVAPQQQSQQQSQHLSHHRSIMSEKYKAQSNDMLMSRSASLTPIIRDDARLWSASSQKQQSVKRQSNIFHNPVQSKYGRDSGSVREPITTLKVKQTDSYHTVLNYASRNHLRKIVQQLLLESLIPAEKLWEDVLMNLLLFTSHNVSPSVQNGDERDIRYYVKVKKIPDGNPIDSQFIQGVVFSKNVMHKRMLKPVTNPKILLIAFPIEFQRVPQTSSLFPNDTSHKLLPLEPVLSHEKEYLYNITSIIVSTGANVVLSRESVSRFAHEYLIDANIVVVQNVKDSVLELAARCTHADIIFSIEQLRSRPRVGICKEFRAQSFLHTHGPVWKQSLIFLEGTPMPFGCTIILRGAQRDILAKLKSIVQFCLHIVNSLKLETSLYTDLFAKSYSDSTEESADSSLSKLYSDKLNFTTNDDVSASPFVHFPPPFLLSKMAEAASMSSLLHPLTRQQYIEFTRELALDDQALRNVESEVDYHRSLSGLSYLLNTATLHASEHQNIAVLYSIVNSKTSAPCQQPDMRIIEYYQSKSDQTLGEYITDLCLTAHNICSSEGCSQTMLCHYQSFTHGNGCIMVSTESKSPPIIGSENSILMWSRCKICQKETPVVQMSEETWTYSFGKYLELSFYNSQVKSRADICPHNLFQDTLRYFSYKKVTVQVMHETVELFEIFAPPSKLQISSEINRQLKLQEIELRRTQIMKYYDSVHNRLLDLSSHLVSTTKVQLCKDELGESLKKSIGEKKLMLQILQQTIVSSSAEDTLSLTKVLKIFQSNIHAWDLEFSRLLRAYFQPDVKELRRLTTVQLKKIFNEKDLPLRAPLLPLMSQDYNDLESEGELVSSGLVLPYLGVSPTINFGGPDDTASEVNNVSGMDHHFSKHSDNESFQKNSQNNKSLSLSLQSQLSLFSLIIENKLPENDDDFHAEFVSDIVIPMGTPTLSFEAYPSNEEYLDLINASLIDSILQTKPQEIESVAIENSSSENGQKGESTLSLNLKRTENVHEGSIAVKSSNLNNGKHLPLIMSRGANDTILSESNKDEMLNSISGVAVGSYDSLDDELASIYSNRKIGSVPSTRNIASGAQVHDTESLQYTERNTIIRAISGLWSGLPPGIVPLEYPVSSGEHIFNDSLVIIREDEPSSIIAFTLR
ncbi:hypothetical protein BJ742DRAFT_278669 [Cladochytrium replicatum]|nr:hypothetical protein BJ742DRAFT_278669 [Cladochytrium replicatum]